MLWYPKKPEGGIRKASKKHDTEDKLNAPANPSDAAVYWSGLSVKYAETSVYYTSLAVWWNAVSILLILVWLLVMLIV